MIEDLRLAGARPTAPDEPDQPNGQVSSARRPGSTAAAPWQSWPAAFSEQVRRTPSAIAVAWGDRAWSYAEFAGWADRLAAVLAHAGVRPGDLVAVPGGPSPTTAVAIVAAWRIGAVYLPVEIDQPPARARQLLSVAAPAAVVADPEAVLPEAFAGVPQISATASEGGQLVVAAPPPWSPSPHDAAYLIFTSGSSGEPRGVLVGHRGVLRMARALAAALGTGPGARMLQFAPTTFDASVAELTLALCSGATAVFPSPGQQLSGDGIAAMISTLGVSHLIMVPSLLDTVPEERVPHGLHVVVAGERLDGSILRRWAPRHHLHNAYGPTEATVCTTISAELVGDETTIPIGTAIPGWTTRVVDEHLRPVRRGTPGELLIGGDGVALGYLARSDLAEPQFLPGPCGRPRDYRSGDLVRELPDGQLEFVGRLDRQLKLRGRRIEPGEVEAALLELPAVRRARVTVSTDQLVAHVVASAGANAQQLKRDLGSRLPRYLVPDRVVLVDAFPLTRHGKVDDRALVTASAPPLTVTPDVARSPQEHVLCRIFAEILALDRVGRSADFFDLGGHSMLAAQLVLRVRAVLGVELSMRALLEAPTPAALAGRLALPERLSDSLDVLLPLRRSGARPPLFCVHPSTGLSWGYAGLLRHLPDRPVWGLQARAMTDAGFAAASVEEIAADYLARIDELQPTGPVHLLGYSFGGRVAFEMAVALQERHRSVGTVMLLDSSPPPETPYDVSTTGFDRDSALHDYFVAMLAETAPESNLVWTGMPLAQIKAELDRLGSPYALLSDSHFQQMFELNKVSFRLSRRYVPRRRLQGRLNYVRAVRPGEDARSHPVGSPGPAQQWAAHVDGSTVEHLVPGSHNTLIQPASLALLGPVLEKELGRTDLDHAAAH